MKSFLDEVTVGTKGRADAHDPVVAEADEEIHKQIWETAIQSRVTHMHVNLHVTDWVAAQQEDPILKTVIEWISNQRIQDLKHLLGDDTSTEERMVILWEKKKLMLYQRALYHCHVPAGELEEAMQFVVPKAHWVAAMDKCHRDAVHKGQQQMLNLLWDQFWWFSIAAQMQKAISNCEWCNQHGGTCTKVPMQPIIVSAPLEFLHIDFLSIEMTMEFDQPPNMVNVLVFCAHFMKHIMAYVTLEQTAKTVAKFLWQGYISIFGALAKLLSDWEANFESNIVKELCELMGIQKVRTSPYHAQSNRQVEQAQQTLMHMIGKLSKDQKVDWPKHIQELVHAYKSTGAAITGYSQHYLMFGHWLHSLIDFYFPPIKGTEKHQHVDYYIVELCEPLWEAFNEVQAQSMSEAERQKWYYERKVNAISHEPGDLVLATSWRTSGQDTHESFTGTNFFSLLPQRVPPFEQLCRLSGQGVPPLPQRNKLWKGVRLRKHHKVWIVELRLL